MVTPLLARRRRAVRHIHGDMRFVVVKPFSVRVSSVSAFPFSVGRLSPVSRTPSSRQSRTVKAEARAHRVAYGHAVVIARALQLGDFQRADIARVGEDCVAGQRIRDGSGHFAAVHPAVLRRNREIIAVLASNTSRTAYRVPLRMFFHIQAADARRLRHRMERPSVTVWFFASTVMFFGVLPSTVGRLFVCVRSIQSA